MSSGHDKLPASRPLAGRTIVTTRTREQAGTLSHLLTDLGARVIELPTIAIAPPDSYEPLDRALAQLDRYDRLLVTSANAARVVGERRSAPVPPRLAVGAVGRSTAAALAAAGFSVALVPEPFVAESLVAALRGRVAGQRILLARAAVARDVLPDALRAEGATVDIVDTYRTVIAEDSLALAAQIFGPGASVPDAVTFTSSSTVDNFFALLAAAGCAAPPPFAAISIGPVTSATLRAHDRPPAAEAVPHDVPGLVAAIVRSLGS